MAETQLVSIEKVRLEGLAAYARLHQALSEPTVISRYLLEFKQREWADQVSSLLVDLPAPVDTLPLTVLAALGHHAQRGQLERFYWMAPDGTSTTDSSDLRPVSEPLRQWSQEHSDTFTRLFITTSNEEMPWVGWRPPPGDGPLAPGRVSWSQLTSVAAQVSVTAGGRDLSLVTIGFVLVRDWSFDLLPLFEQVGLDLDLVIEELRSQVASRSPSGAPTAAVERARTAEVELSAQVGLPTCAWTVFAVLVGVTVGSGPRLLYRIRLSVPIDLERVLVVLRRGRSPQLRARPAATVTSDYWTVDDRLGYDFYADAIADFIRHPETVPPLTIGIKGAWGSGKTSLMRMVRARIDPDLRRQLDLRLSPKPLKTSKPAAPSGARVTVKEALDLSRTPKPEDLKPVAVDEASRQQDQAVFRPTVWFNAWMYQSGEQIWAGLANAIMSQITERLPPAQREEFWLRLTLSRVDSSALRRRIYRVFLERVAPVVVVAGALLGLAGAVLLAGLAFPALLGNARAAAGLLIALALPGSALETLRRWREFLGQELATTAADVLKQPDYEGRLGFLYLVQTDMKRILDLVSSPERPVVVFVDDLDRCSQATVTQVIEAVNLFLGGQFPNCIFVLAMEPEIVAANIDVAYSQVLAELAGEQSRPPQSLGWRFLEKMVQLPLTLPRPDQAQLDGYISAVLSHRQVPPAPINEERVRDLQVAIRQRTSSIAEIRQAALAAQQALAGGATPASELSPEAIAAAEEAFSDSFTDQDPEVKAMIVRHAAYLSDNAREIKRFINLFRFYAFIQVRRELRGLPTPSLEQVAKIAILAIRWPELLGGLLQPSAQPGAGTVLATLERMARSSKLDDKPSELWKEKLTAFQLNRWRPLVAAEELRDLLAQDPLVADSVAGFL